MLFFVICNYFFVCEFYSILYHQFIDFFYKQENLAVPNFINRKHEEGEPVQPLPLESTPFKQVESVNELKMVAAKLRGVDEFAVSIGHISMILAHCDDLLFNSQMVHIFISLEFFGGLCFIFSRFHHLIALMFFYLILL